MLESQLPSFNSPPPKKPRGKAEPVAEPKKPLAEPLDDPNASKLRHAGHTGDTSISGDSDHSVGPLAEGYATLDPNVDPPTERNSSPSPVSLLPNAPVAEGHHTLDLPDHNVSSPNELAARVSSAPRPPLPPGGGSATLAHPNAKRAAAGPSGMPRVPGYVIMGELGKGGMGVVYKAMQTGLNRLVALKMIRKDRATEEAISRFQDEAKAVARLHHPNIVQIFDIGEFEEQPYFSLEFVDGGSLDRLIKGNPQMPRDSATLVQTLANAMQLAHEQNIVHRDLKPANVLVQSAPGVKIDDKDHINPSKIIPKITDFGLAKQLDNADLSQTNSGAVLGTPYYMAPEQAEGWVREIKPWTDVYALGAILYELLTGRPPFKGATLVETLDQVRHLDPVAPRVLQPSVPRDLETICLKCLRKQPSARYPTAGELSADLQRFLEDRPILGRPIGYRERFVKWAKRSPMAAAATAISLLLVLSLIVTLSVLFHLSEQRNAQREKIVESRNRFETLMSEANDKTQLALMDKNKDPRLWEESLTAVKEAQAVLNNNEELSKDESLRERVERLYKQASAEVEGGKKREEARKLAEANHTKLREFHDTAVVYSTLYTGLTGEQNSRSVAEQVTPALKLFNINPAEPVPPVLDPEFYPAKEQQQILDWYYSLLVFEAQATFRQALEEKSVDKQRAEVRRALEQLNRADRFRSPGKGGPDLNRTNASLQKRVEFLEFLKDTVELERANEQLKRSEPKDPLDYFLAALAWFTRPNRTKTVEEAQINRRMALSLADKALERDPNYFGARYLSTICQLQEGNLAVARDQLTVFLEKQEKFVWLRLLRGFVLMQMGNLTDAQKDFDKASEHPNPKIRYVALVNGSALSTRLQVWDMARDALSQAIAVMIATEKQEDDPADQSDQAKQRRAFEAAFPYQKYLILLDPSVNSATMLARPNLTLTSSNSTTAFINLAMVNKKRAETPWTAYLTLLDPSLASAVALAARESEPVRNEVRRNALAEAVLALDRALEKPSNARELLFSERGRLYLELEDDKRAQADLIEATKSSKQGGQDEETGLSERVKKDCLSLADLHFRNRDYPATIEVCQDVIRLAPEQLAAYRLKARAEIAQDRLSQARRTLEDYLQEAIKQGIREIKPEELADVYRTQGILFAKGRDYRGAIESYTQGLQLYRRAERSDPALDPIARKSLTQLLSLRGWAYLGEDAASLAAKDFDEALHMDAKYVDARIGKAESLVRQSKLFEAVAAAEQARQLDGKSSRVQFSAARIYAQAYGQGLRSTRPADVKDSDVVRWGEQAIDLLIAAVDKAEKPAEFWKQYIETDNAFKPLRSQPAMDRLEQRATGIPR